MEWFNASLRLLDILARWPVATAVIAIFFMHEFRAPLAQWIQRAAVSYSDRNGRSVSIAPQPPPGNAPSAAEEAAAAARLDGTASTTASVDTIQSLQHEVDAWRLHARNGWSNYLEMFFVPKTKSVIGEIEKQGRMTDAEFFHLVAQVAPQNSEYQAVIDALVKHGMVKIEGGHVEKTRFMQDYLAWRKESRLPELPPLGAFVQTPARIAELFGEAS